jgi:AcrR family transcriptional regulator
MAYQTRVGERRRTLTRARIITAALPVFAEHGPDAPVIDDFIQAAAISRGTFYNHFRTVAELLAATSENLTEELAQLIDAKLVNVTAPDLRIAIALRLIGQKALNDRHWCLFLSRASHVGVHARQYLQRDLTVGQRLDVFDLPDVTAAFDLITGTTMQTLRAIESGQCRTLEDLRSHLQLVFRALGVPAARIDRLLTEPLPQLESKARPTRPARRRKAPAVRAAKRTD